MHSAVLAGTPVDLLTPLALAVGLVAFLVVTLRREVGVPIVIGLLVVPVGVGAGFGLALAIHAWLAVNLLYAAAVLSGVLIVLVGLLEALKLWTAEPPPPQLRY